MIARVLLVPVPWLLATASALALDAPATSGRAGMAQARPVQVMPPPRQDAAERPSGPDDGVVIVSAGPAEPFDTRFQAVPEVPAGSPVTTLPPRRPDADPESASASGFILDAPAPAAPPVVMSDTPVAKPATIAVLPPLRPSFPTDEAVADTGASPAPAGTDIAEVVPESAKPRSVVRVIPPSRPDFPWDEPTETASIPTEAPPAAPRSLFGALFGSPVVATPSMLPAVQRDGHNGIDAMITRHAALNNVPEELVHRVVIRESKYNPAAVGHGGALGLMQIKHPTARALGYNGPASGLLDADTNLTYAVKYLAGAYRLSGGDYRTAIRYYARGYYYEAKREGRVRYASHETRHAGLRQEADASTGGSEAPIIAAALGERPGSAK